MFLKGVILFYKIIQINLHIEYTFPNVYSVYFCSIVMYISSLIKDFIGRVYELEVKVKIVL